MIRWTRRAIADLVAIGDYIARDRPATARNWVERLRVRACAAAEVPFAGRMVPEFGREEIREVFLRSYRIIYRASGKGIVVLTVLEGHRLLREAGEEEGE